MHQSFATEEASLEATVQLMAEYVLGPEGSLHPTVRAWALSNVWGCAPMDTTCYAGRFLDGMRRDTPYRRDPVHSELVQTPQFTLAYHGGDCDDLTTFAVACGITLGERSAFLTGALHPGLPTHVLPAFLTPRGWLPLDPSLQHSKPEDLARGFRVDEILEVM